MSCRSALALMLAVTVGTQAAGAQGPQALQAGSSSDRLHAITREHLDTALGGLAARRERNLRTIRRFLEEPDVARMAAQLGNPKRLSVALTALDERTVERLAAEAERVSRMQSGTGPGKVFLIVVLVLVVLVVAVTAALPESS